MNIGRNHGSSFLLGIEKKVVLYETTSRYGEFLTRCVRSSPFIFSPMPNISFIYLMYLLFYFFDLQREAQIFISVFILKNKK
jgi:hypothetical protein